MTESLSERIITGRMRAEKQFVFSLFKDVSWVADYRINRKNIKNSLVAIYYTIYEQIATQRNVQVIDESVIDDYLLGKPEQLRKAYETYGGWATIADFHELIPSVNIQAYYDDFQRYLVFDRLNKSGVLNEKLFEGLSNAPIEEIEDVVNGKMNDVFSDVNSGSDRVRNIDENILDYIDKADSGILRGLPVSSEYLNSLINGLSLGNITMVGGNSGAGKTFLTLALNLPTVFREKEPVLIVCNEEDMEKWQGELLTWIVNNVLIPGKYQDAEEFEKQRFFQGRFTKEEKQLLTEAAYWLQAQQASVEGGLIKFVNLQTFSMSKAIRLIKKYAIQFDFKYFILDTLKIDNDIGTTNMNNQAWLHLQQNMVRLYNTIKPSSLNVHVWVTYQLSKSQKVRYLDQTCLGMSKNVADVVSTLILFRGLTEKEKENGGLVVKNHKKVDQILSVDNDYAVLFLDKNRQGSTHRQVVIATDKGKNKIRDVGFTQISQEF